MYTPKARPCWPAGEPLPPWRAPLMVGAPTPVRFRGHAFRRLAPRLPNGANGGAWPGRGRPSPNGEFGGARRTGATPPTDGGVVVRLAWDAQGAGLFTGQLRVCARAERMPFRAGAPTNSGPPDVSRT